MRFLLDLLWGLTYRALTAVDDAIDAWGDDEARDR